jgi:hypothetical protein
MPNKYWKVHVPLKIRYPGTGTSEIAAVDEILEERVTAGTPAGDGDVRVYRLQKGHNDFQSFLVSRSELDANARAVTESGSD